MDRFLSDFFWFRQISESLAHQYSRDVGLFLEYAETTVRSGNFHADIWQNHFRPQAAYFEDVAYDFVCHTDSLGHDVQRVFDEVGYEADLQHHNKSVRSPIPSETMHTIRERVQRIYADDYRLLDAVQRWRLRVDRDGDGDVRKPFRLSSQRPKKRVNFRKLSRALGLKSGSPGIP